MLRDWPADWKKSGCSFNRREAAWLLRRVSHDEWTDEELARGCDGLGLPRLQHPDLGWPHQELLQQLLLPGCRFARLPDELRRMPCHLLLRVQHEVLHVHVLLPKQVTPYRIDFPKVNLKNVKNVRMAIKASLVPASADPVIGVMNQKVDG